MKNQHLNSDQKIILQKFCNVFLPPTNNKRKYKSNELDYVSSSLNRVFYQNFGFNLSRDHVRDNFSEMGYQIFTKGGVWDPDEKKLKPSASSTMVKVVAPKADPEPLYTYFNISPTMISNLRRTTAKLPQNTNESKRKEIEELKTKIKDFAEFT